MSAAYLSKILKLKLRNYSRAHQSLTDSQTLYQSLLPAMGEFIHNLLITQSKNISADYHVPFFKMLDFILSKIEALDDDNLTSFKKHFKPDIALLCTITMHLVHLEQSTDPYDDINAFNQCIKLYEKTTNVPSGRISWVPFEYAILDIIERHDLGLRLAICCKDDERTNTYINAPAFDATKAINGITHRAYALKKNYIAAVRLMDQVTINIDSNKITKSIIELTKKFPALQKHLVVNETSTNILMKIIYFVKENNILHTARLEKMSVHDSIKKAPVYARQKTEKHFDEYIEKLKNYTLYNGDLYPKTELENFMLSYYRIIKKIGSDEKIANVFFTPNSDIKSKMTLPLLCVLSIAIAQNVGFLCRDARYYYYDFQRVPTNESYIPISYDDWAYWQRKIYVTLGLLGKRSTSDDASFNDPIKPNQSKHEIWGLMKTKKTNDILKWIEKCNDLNITDAEQNTLLHAAAANQHEEIVQKLLEKKEIPINAQNKLGCTAFYAALYAKNPNLDIIKLLIKYKADFDSPTGLGHNALYIALLTGASNVIQLLIDNGATPTCGDLTFRTSNGWTLLQEAILHEQDALANLIIQRSRYINLKSFNEHEYTALHLAVHQDNIAIVEELLRHENLDINIQNNDGMTALHTAIYYGKTDIAKALLKHKKIDISIKDNDEMTALELATYFGRSEIEKELLTHKNADITTKDNDETKPLSLVAYHHTNDMAKSFSPTGKEPVKAVVNASLK